MWKVRVLAGAREGAADRGAPRCCASSLALSCAQLFVPYCDEPLLQRPQTEASWRAVRLSPLFPSPRDTDRQDPCAVKTKVTREFLPMPHCGLASSIWRATTRAELSDASADDASAADEDSAHAHNFRDMKIALRLLIQPTSHAHHTASRPHRSNFRRLASMDRLGAGAPGR